MKAMKDGALDDLRSLEKTISDNNQKKATLRDIRKAISAGVSTNDDGKHVFDPSKVPSITYTDPETGKEMQVGYDPGVARAFGADWPDNSFRTAGGYTVVFDGNKQSMKIFGPDQKPGDTPLVNVWGDPHVYEADGTKWDFTKDSDMVLPDGTLIAMDTTSETGRSYLDNVTIVNGNDRIDISGIRSGKPTAGTFSTDGEAWRAQHAATRHAGWSTYQMGSRPGEAVTFNLLVGGTDRGEITSARYAGGAYVQNTNAARQYQGGPVPQRADFTMQDLYKRITGEDLNPNNAQVLTNIDNDISTLGDFGQELATKMQLFNQRFTEASDLLTGLLNAWHGAIKKIHGNTGQA